jgi:hypothetical protein
MSSHPVWLLQWWQSLPPSETPGLSSCALTFQRTKSCTDSGLANKVGAEGIQASHPRFRRWSSDHFDTDSSSNRQKKYTSMCRAYLHFSRTRLAKRLWMKYSLVNNSPDGDAFNIIRLTQLKKIVNVICSALSCPFLLELLHFLSLQTHVQMLIGPWLSKRIWSCASNRSPLGRDWHLPRTRIVIHRIGRRHPSEREESARNSRKSVIRVDLFDDSQICKSRPVTNHWGVVNKSKGNVLSASFALRIRGTLITSFTIVLQPPCLSCSVRHSNATEE